MWQLLEVTSREETSSKLFKEDLDLEDRAVVREDLKGLVNSKGRLSQSSRTPLMDKDNNLNQRYNHLKLSSKPYKSKLS